MNEEIKAYKLNNKYLMLKIEDKKAIYDIENKQHHLFQYGDDVPQTIRKNYTPKEFYDTLRLCDNNSEETVDISLIDDETLRNFGIDKNKPNIRFGYDKRYQKLINIKKSIEDYYKIKVNADNNNEKYYYNYNTHRYELLNVFKLGFLLEEDFGITLTENDCNTIFRMFRKETKPNYHAISFNNVVLNTDTFEIMPQDTFTVKRIDYDYLPLEETKSNTLVERTLKEIFIPANSPNKEKYFLDFLERNGASFKSENKHKMIYMLTGSGDDGKGIVLKILQMVHGSQAVIIKPKHLIDNFYSVNLSDTNVILMDELNKNSFNQEIVAVLKDITGRGSSDSRIMHSQETVKVKDYGVVFIATNVIPYVPYSERAYWQRVILINLPNKFEEDVEFNDIENNIYKADEDLSSKLKEDKDGLEWLISASINAYKNRKNGFTVKQSAIDTQFLIDKDNPISMFIKNNIVYTGNKDDVVSNRDIRYNFLKFCEKHDLTKNDVGVLSKLELSKEIGINIKNKIIDLDNSIKKGGSKAYRGIILNIDYSEDDVEYFLPVLEQEFFDY